VTVRRFNPSSPLLVIKKTVPMTCGFLNKLRFQSERSELSTPGGDLADQHGGSNRQQTEALAVVPPASRARDRRAKVLEPMLPKGWARTRPG
jgi:hypothetical protein